MLNKNDVVTVEITDIGVGGEGIGRVDGYTLFIKASHRKTETAD